jgi:hypothetical protein
MTVPVKMPAQGDIMESVIVKGDLAKLTPDERVRYYGEVCRSIGLNPLTKPFEFITLNGKLQLYALRTCADQLRKINGVTLEIVSQEVAHDVLTVHVRAKLPDGRSDEDLGAVPFPETLKGEARANAALKAVTKAKRRATLSICGLGWLDETEVESIPGAKRPAPPAANVMLPPHDEKTGEIVEDHPSAPRDAADEPAPASGEEHAAGAGLSLEAMAREAASRGEATFKTFYKGRNKSEQATLNAMGDELRGLMGDAQR